MRLIIHEFNPTSVFQTIVPDKNKMVRAIRPHLYIHNNPTGNVTVKVCDSNGDVIAESETIAFSTITDAIEYHGYITFYIDAYLRKDTSYRIYVVAGGGYSFSESAYAGVCSDWEFRKYPEQVASTHSIKAPIDFEIWTLSQK